MRISIPIKFIKERVIGHSLEVCPSMIKSALWLRSSAPKVERQEVIQLIKWNDLKNKTALTQMNSMPFNPSLAKLLFEKTKHPFKKGFNKSYQFI